MKRNHHPRQEKSISEHRKSAFSSFNAVGRHGNNTDYQNFRHHRQKNRMQNGCRKIRMSEQILKILYIERSGRSNRIFQNIPIALECGQQGEQYRVNK